MCLVALSGGGASHTAHAQGDEDDYVDVALTLETPDTEPGRELTVIVMNLGSRTAYDVEVVVNIVFPENLSFFRFPPDVPIGTASLENGGHSFRWTIPELLGLQRVAITELVTDRFSGPPALDAREYPHEFYGEVTTASFESEHRGGNNTDRVWSVLTNLGDHKTGPARSIYSVAVSVDERYPSPGDIVNFTVTTSHSATDFSVIDQEVAIELTDGLAVDEDASADPPRTISYTPEDRAASVSYSNGVFNIGTLKLKEWTRNHSVTLPIRVANNAVVNEQCLTATITGSPPPEASPRDDDRSDNVAKLCLGPPVLPYFTSDDLQEFISHPCVDNSDHPCDNTDDVTVRAIDAASGLALDAGTPLIHVPDDSTTRMYDGDTKSVNSEDKVSWQTTVQIGYEPYASEHERWAAITHNLAYGMIGKDGALDKLHVRPAWGANDIFLNDGNRNADLFSFPPAASGSNGPFDMTAEFEKLGTYKMDYTVTTTHDNNTDMDTTDDLEYSATGSYIFHVGPMVELEVRDGGASPDVAADQYGITISALNNRPDYEVDAEVMIDLSSLPAGVTVDDHMVSGPDDDPDGTYSAGKWDLGALKTADHRRSAGKPEAATLTLILAGDNAATAMATATIANVANYTVCISGNGGTLGHANQTDCEGDTDAATTNVWHTAVCVLDSDQTVNTEETHDTQAECEAQTDAHTWTENVCALGDGGVLAGRTEAECGASWHTGTVYDYNDDNNTATITARAGTGGGIGEGMPTLETPAVHAPAVGFSWSEVESLYGVPVKDYQVQWSTNGVSGWTQLETDLSFNKLFDITIQSGVTRYYRVRAVNEAGVPGPWSKPVAAMVEQQATAGAPDAPVLTAVPNEPNGRTEILITWTKPIENGSAITSYTLQVADRSSGPWTDVSPQPDAADESYVYSDGLTGGTRKHFRMLATNMCDGNDPAIECDSLWSDVVDVTTRAPGISGAPINVRAAADGDTAIDVSWDAPLDDGGTPITRYQVQWSADGVGGWRNAGSTPDGITLTFKNTGMTFGTTRYYRVAARNSRGLSAWSDPPYASATTLSGVPGQPRLTVRATDANTIALTWTEPADNGDPITRYEIQWSEDGAANSWNPLVIAGASDTSYDDSNLDPGTQRYYQVRAVNDTGEGSWSTVRNAVTPPAMPSAPTLYAQANGENAIDLSWDPPFDDGGADIRGYELQVSTNGGQTYSRLTNPSASARAYTHSGLKPGNERHYQLRARNRAGWGEFSQPAFSITATGVPTAPSLTARANGSTEIKLSWTKPDDRGAYILRYELQQSDDGNDWNTLSASIPGNDSEYVHSGLRGGTKKYYRIRATNGNGEGQWSTTRSTQTQAGGPEAPVLSLSVASDNQIDLSWTVPADNGSPIRGYWVERSADGDAPWERLTSSQRTTTYSDDSLYRGMTRYYRVAATNSAGAGPYSNVASETTTGDPATAPSPPTFFRLTDVNRNQVTLAWDPPTDNGGAPVSGYEYEAVYPAVDGPPQRIEGTTTGTSARIGNLKMDGSYLFQVRAVNPVGKGQWASDIQASIRPSLNGSVRVSPTTITVDEGKTVSYTIRLSTAPPHPVELLVMPQKFEGADDLEDAASAYAGSVLIPSGWTHPDGADWSDFAYNWSRGVPATFTAPEDNDTVDDVTVIDHWVIAVPYDNYYPCADAANVEKCTKDWEEAWAKSPYQSLTGASVKITVLDND